MSVIEMHSSWLAINSIVGCPNNCKYCLLQATNDNNCFPRQLVSPKEYVWGNGSGARAVVKITKLGY